ncbi:hypothetical protein BLL42_27555 (plasmid) [Pseudomonas frederiksbergensis]|uniref:Uncharacterized protein n=1 Tax=Pseudomonas frederiksbergensis TaxID=104087 RepID=A0A1J0ETK9_9PSED|nr:hypothetical protein [Pseudomonas frederiksbergensis]APC19493.1 hypothetical protein BLL42_27555 [Pseudomonas frederiksbergensis]
MSTRSNQTALYVYDCAICGHTGQVHLDGSASEIRTGCSQCGAEVVAAELDNTAAAGELVSDLLDIITYLTDASGEPDYPGRFVSIRSEVDVSATVNPVIARAEAFLRAISDGAGG